MQYGRGKLEIPCTATGLKLEAAVQPRLTLTSMLTAVGRAPLMRSVNVGEMELCDRYHSRDFYEPYG
jgi:hypothetical protein